MPRMHRNLHVPISLKDKLTELGHQERTSVGAVIRGVVNTYGDSGLSGLVLAPPLPDERLVKVNYLVDVESWEAAKHRADQDMIQLPVVLRRALAELVSEVVPPVDNPVDNEPRS